MTLAATPSSSLTDEQRSFVDEFVQDRASQSLAHVFTLLSLVLPAEPLRTAFRALHTNDQRLRGTALEYLEGVLPQDLRQRLWPFLEDKRIRGAAQRSVDDAEMKYVVVHLHRLLEPEGISRPKDAKA